ncbi:MAG: DNA-protecting protein DprA [Bacteroidetes bacterium]|nr:DNA-protecting protein DprA [Bacteroidota bacterium]
MYPDLIFQLALTRIPLIGPVQARILSDQFETAEDIFKAKRSLLEKIEGIGTVRADKIRSFCDFKPCEQEIAFIEKHGIQPLFLKNTAYPQRLLNCFDPPTLLFYKGNADLNASKMIAIIGTRNCSDYGKQFVQTVSETLAQQGATVVSGLALGIDAAAHKSALKNNIPTIGVLAHAMDKIYPYTHKSLAQEMLSNNGGLLTEYPSGFGPERHHFPTRNRIVAGICDAVIVVETGLKGGSMITAEMAFSYNRDIFALPGRSTDTKSIGCNHLIKYQKALMITSGQDLVRMMNWDIQKPAAHVQRKLFVTLSEEEQKITEALEGKEQMHIDELYRSSGLSSSMAAAAILNLELQGIVASLPGKCYRLC